MRNFFIDLHNLMAKWKIASVIFILSLLAVAVYYAWQIKLEEDVSAIIPRDERINKVSDAISQSKFADQIIVMFSLYDDEDTNPDELIITADQLVTKLSQDTSLVNSIKFRTEMEVLMGVYNFIYENLPLFLEEDDYKTLETRLKPENVASELESNFRTLISPVGIVTKEFILKDPLHLTTIAMAKLENFQLDDNFHIYNSCVFTKDNKNLLIFIDPHFPASNTSENKHLIEFLDEAVKELLSEHPEVNIQYYGGTAVAVANAERIKTDIMITVSAAMLILGIFFYLVFRRIRFIVLIFLPILIGIITALALMVIIEGTVSAMALGVGAVLIGISLDYSLHAFTHFRESGSVLHTLKSISKPVLMSSFSTALAFICLFIVQSKALNQLGMFAAIAIVSTAFAVLIVLPLFLRGFKKGLSDGKRIGFLDNIAAYKFEKNKIILFAVFSLTVLFFFTSGRLSFNSDLNSLNYQPEKLTNAENKLKEISAEAYSAVFLISQGKTLDQALQISESKNEVLKKLRDEKVVYGITSASELIFSSKKQEERIERWNDFWSKEKIDLVKNMLIEKGRDHKFNPNAFQAFYNLLHKDFEVQTDDQFNLIKEQFLSNNISETDGVFSVVSIVKVSQERKNELFSAINHSEDVLIFDNQYYIDRFLDVLKDDFRLLVLLSMALIFVILLVSYGRIEFAIIAFIPILLSWFWTIGLMGLLGIEFNIFNIIITTFVFGLGIDYSIFIMSGLINKYKYGNTEITPYKMSVLLSAITTITSFGVLIFAQHPVLRSIALVSILGISSVILITYTLLPLMFNFLVSNKGKTRIQPITLYNFTVSLNALILFLAGSFLMTTLMPLVYIFPLRKKYKKRFVHKVICKFSLYITIANHGVKRHYINKEKIDFSKPKVIISNHQSYIDLVYLLQLNPKIIAFTNSWVYNSWFFGAIIRYADYYPVFKGLDENFEKLEEKIKQGYSLLIFPEGTRSPDGKIKRFHQGALYVADKLNLEIQPVMIHGIYEAIPKTEFFLKSGKIHIKFFDPVKVTPASPEEGDTFKEQAKEITSFYRKEFKKLQRELETTRFFKRILISQYLYKGPILEWYLKTKIKAEDYYSFFNEIIPHDAVVADIGCGYGFLSYMLHFTSKNRVITGVDYDDEKIMVADNIKNRTENLKFVLKDITEEDMPQAEVYIFNDVLHYIPKDLRKKVLVQAMNNIKEKGFIILRDADTDLKTRTYYTKYTEIQSTKIIKFNKKKYKLSYFSGREIESIAHENGFIVERIDQSKLTSNITYIIKHPDNE